MIEVEFGDRIVEFPDDMSEGLISSALKDIETRETKKESLRQQTEVARKEAKVNEFISGAIDLLPSMVEPLTPSGMMNQPFRVVGMEDPYAAGRPLVTIPKPTGTGVVSGLGQLGAGLVEGLATPEMIVTAPAFGPSPLVRAITAGQMAQTLPESISQGAEVLRNPEATPAEKVVAAGQPLVTAGMVRALGGTGKWLLPVESPNIPIAPTYGRALPITKGSRAPRPEPVAAPERLSPEQAAIQSERMSQEATAAVEPAVAPPAEAAVPPPVESAPKPAQKGKQPKITYADLSQVEQGTSEKPLKVKASGAYNMLTGRTMLDKSEVSKLSPEERAAVVRHELAHKIETESELWQASDDFLWRLWEADKLDPLWNFMSETTGKWKFGNDQSPEIIAELYAKHYPKGTFTVRERPVVYEWEGENWTGPKEYPIPPEIMSVLDQIEAKLGIWSKKSQRGSAQPKPSPVESGTAEPGTVPPAAAVGEVSATPGAVAPAPPPAISEATTQTKGKQTGALELPKLEKANVKADPRLSTPGITKKAKPNSLVIQLRDLESNPIREITVESSGDPLTDSKIVGDTINENATNPNVSIRESLGVSTGPNGRAIYQFGISPNGMTWVEAGKLIEARKQRVAIENPKAAPLPPLEMGTSYPYLNTIVVAIKLSPDGKHVQVRDLKSSTGKKEWVPVNKLNTARFLARANAIEQGVGSKPTPAPAAKPAAKEPWQMTLQQTAEASGKFSKDVVEKFFKFRSQWDSLPESKQRAYFSEYDPPSAYAARMSGITGDGLSVLRAQREGHRPLIEKSLSEGKPVPPEVLADYPDLAKPAETTAAPIPQGPGARTYQPEREAQTPESFSGTSLQNAVGELERASYGFAPSDPTIVKPMATEWIRSGITLAKDPLAGERLISELISNPDRRVTDAESAVLLRQKVLIENDMNRAAEQSVVATDPQAKAAAQTRFDTLSNQLLDLLNVAKSQGREWGREGRWRQMFAAEDMSLSTLITNRRASLGRELNPAEVAELKAFADRNKELVAQLEKRNAELQAERDAAEAKQIAAQAEIDAKMAKMPSGYVVKIAEEIVASWDKRADAARARIKERMARTSAGVDPTIVLDVAEIGLSHLGHIGLDFVKWADAVKRDIGDWAEPYLKAAWEKTKTLADEEINLRKGKAKATEIKKAIGPKISVLTKVQQKYAKRIERAEPVGDIHWDARKIARYFWLNGIREPMALVDAVHEVFKQFVPDMTKRQVMDAMSGYGQYRPLPKDAVSAGLRDVYGQLQQVGKLDDMANKVAPKKTGFERRTPSDEERRLIKQVEEAKKAGGYDITDPATQLRTAMQAAERRLTNQINDLQHEIDTRTKIVRNKTKLVFDDKLNALKARRDALKEIHDEVFKPAPLTEAERLAIWKQKAREWIETWKERLELKDVHPKPRPDPIRLDPEAISIRREQQKVRHAVLEMRIKDQLKQRTTQRKIADSIGNTIVFLRAAMAGMEFSAVFKQGATGVFGRPITTARALKKMFQAFSSEDKQFAIMDEIFTRENAPLYERGKLQFTESGVRLSTMEEMYMFRFAEWMKRVPVLRHYIKTMDAFQRAFTTFLNVMRADTMDAMIKENGTDPKTLIDIANTINVFTGRGSASLNRLGAVPNQVFFAPRWAISRFQLLLGQPLWSASKGNRMMVAKEYGRVLLGLGAFYALGYAAGGKVDWNPVSSEFGKIKLGDRVIDPLFGLAPVMRLIAQSVSGLRKNSKGKIRPTREKEFIPKPFRGMVQGGFKRGPYEPSGTELIGRFAWSKLAPAPETFVSAAGGQNVVGEPVTLSGKAVQLITPITYNDIFSALKEDGVSPSTAIDLMAIFGLSSYVKKEK